MLTWFSPFFVQFVTFNIKVNTSYGSEKLMSMFFLHLNCLNLKEKKRFKYYTNFLIHLFYF